MFIGSNVRELKGVGVQVVGFHKVFIVYKVTPNAVLSYWAFTGLVTNSNIFCEPFVIKDHYEKFIDSVKPESKVGIIFLNCVLLTCRIVRNTRCCSCISLVMNKAFEARLKGTKASAEKAFQGSEAEAREFLGGKKQNGVHILHVRGN